MKVIRIYVMDKSNSVPMLLVEFSINERELVHVINTATSMVGDFIYSLDSAELESISKIEYIIKDRL